MDMIDLKEVTDAYAFAALAAWDSIHLTNDDWYQLALFVIAGCGAYLLIHLAMLAGKKYNQRVTRKVGLERFLQIAKQHADEAHKRRGELMRIQTAKRNALLADGVTDLLEHLHNLGFLHPKIKKEWYEQLGKTMKIEDLLARPNPRRLKALIRTRLQNLQDYTPVNLPKPPDIGVALASLTKRLRSA